MPDFLFPANNEKHFQVRSWRETRYVSSGTTWKWSRSPAHPRRMTWEWSKWPFRQSATQFNQNELELTVTESQMHSGHFHHKL